MPHDRHITNDEPGFTPSPYGATMHTPILTVQTSNAAPAPASKAPAATGGAERDFQRTLTQQIEQRQLGEQTQQRQAEHRQNMPRPSEQRQAAPQRAAAPQQNNAAAARPAARDKVAGQNADQAAPDQPAAAAPAGAPGASQALDSSQPAGADTRDDSESDAQAALAGPAADMLALVASLNPGIALRNIAASAPPATSRPRRASRPRRMRRRQPC